MAKKKEESNIPSVLSFDKRIVPSDGYMYQTKWDNKEDIKELRIKEKTVLGTISHKLKDADIKSDPLKLNHSLSSGNIQTIDYCALDKDYDTLCLQFSLKFLSNCHIPSSCNNADFYKKMISVVSDYIKENELKELAHRYAVNIANARYLWRNRHSSDKIETHIEFKNGDETETIIFNSFDISLNDFEFKNKDIDKMSKMINDVLISKNDYLILNIKSYARLGDAQEVYPSQEMIYDKSNIKKENKKGKVLCSINNIAGMHSQKIGNAIRRIDNWYPDFSGENCVGVLPVEPYGSVKNLGKACRQPNTKKDFFTLFYKFVEDGNLENENDKMYVVANLIRGGVF